MLKNTANTRTLLQEIFGEHIAGCGFGHCDLQTLPHHTSFCGDFSEKEFIQITHEA
jgi:hypothetical protein